MPASAWVPELSQCFGVMAGHKWFRLTGAQKARLNLYRRMLRQGLSSFRSALCRVPRQRISPSTTLRLPEMALASSRGQVIIAHTIAMHAIEAKVGFTVR